jgi:DNA-binding CsgD family transcriptional regulator
LKDKKPNRSDKYQNLFIESSFPSEMLESFCTEDSIQKRLNPFAYNEEVLDLEIKLRDRFWIVAKENLTERQFEVLKLTALGSTQTEIALTLSVNQSSITKSLHGNVDYKNIKEKKNNSKSYGGSIQKLQKILEKDEETQKILTKIRDIQDSEGF